MVIFFTFGEKTIAMQKRRTYEFFLGLSFKQENCSTSISTKVLQLNCNKFNRLAFLKEKINVAVSAYKLLTRINASKYKMLLTLYF